MNPRGTRGLPAPAAPPGPAPGAAPPGAAPTGIAAANPTGTAEQPAGDGTQLTEASALTRWRFPISTRYGGIVLTLYTDRHGPTGEAAPVDLSAAGGAVARVVGGLLARDWAGVKSAAGDVLHNAADYLSHVHLGLHWKPAPPEPTPEPTNPPTAAPGGGGSADATAGGGPGAVGAAVR